MLDHASLGVFKLAAAREFYDAALAPLGLVQVWSAADAIGYGPAGQDDCFAVKLDDVAFFPSARAHLAFIAASPREVTDFYAASLSHGGTDDGGCGECPEYGEGYFAAFVRDPDGNRIEAVCHERATPTR